MKFDEKLIYYHPIFYATSSIGETVINFKLFGDIILDSIYIISSTLLHCYDAACEPNFEGVDEKEKENFIEAGD